MRRPKDESLNDPPGSDHQEPDPLPEAVGEFNVDISQPKLIGFVDAKFNKNPKVTHASCGQSGIATNADA